MSKTHNFLAALLIVIGAATTTATFAGDLETKGKKYKLFNAGKIVKLIYLSSEALEVAINILNDQGDILYKGVTSSEKGFILPFNMSQLPLGRYTFKIKEGDNEYTETIVTESTATDSKTVTLIKGLDKKAVVVTSTEEIPADLDLIIYGQNGDVLYKEVLDSKKVVSSKYNLESVESDEVRIVIMEGDEILKDSEFKF